MYYLFHLGNCFFACILECQLYLTFFYRSLSFLFLYIFFEKQREQIYLNNDVNSPVFSQLPITCGYVRLIQKDDLRTQLLDWFAIILKVQFIFISTPLFMLIYFLLAVLHQGYLQDVLKDLFPGESIMILLIIYFYKAS